MKEQQNLRNLLLRTKTPFNIRLANYLELSIRFDCAKVVNYKVTGDWMVGKQEHSREDPAKA
jgi:hypothetical protein